MEKLGLFSLGEAFIWTLYYLLQLFLLLISIVGYTLLGLWHGVVWLITNYPRFAIPPLISTPVSVLMSWMLTGEVDVVIQFSLGGGVLGTIVGVILEVTGEQS